MSIRLNNEKSATCNTDSATFVLPKSDIAALRRCSASLEPLNDEALLESYSEDVDTLVLLLEEFQTNGPQRIEKISCRVDAGDPKAVAAAARELKASANALSAKMLHNLAGALEQSTDVVSRGCQERLVARLREEMSRCLNHIPLVIASARTVTCEN